jgi:inhibitor of cysteine peptidase
MKAFLCGAAIGSRLLCGIAIANGQTVMSDPGIMLTEADQSQTVQAHVGQPLTIKLEDNATSGYRWAIESIDPNALEAREPVRDYTSSRPGAPGMIEWSFVPQTPGSVVITLKLWRPWEGDRSIIKRVRYRLEVKP